MSADRATYRTYLAVSSGKASGLVRGIGGADALRAVGIPGRLLTVEWSGPDGRRRGADPLLDPLRIAYSVCAPDGTDRAASRVAGAVDEFLGALDRDLLKLPVGRPLTGREYALLAGRPERVQAVTVFPWLLPWTCAGLAAANPEPAERVLAAIDARAELLSALCREPRAEPNVVRSLAAVGAWHPRARGYPVADFETDPAFYAAVFSLVPPERRPGATDFGRFLKAARWAAGILRDAGDHEGRTALAETSAAAWEVLRRRPYELPDRHGTAWLEDFAEQAGKNPAIGGRPFAGTLRGETVRLEAGTWTVLWALCRYHPADLPAAGQAWTRKETAAVRETVREGWPAGDPIPSPFPDVHDCGGGGRPPTRLGRGHAEPEAVPRPPQSGGKGSGGVRGSVPARLRIRARRVGPRREAGGHGRRNRALHGARRRRARGVREGLRPIRGRLAGTRGMGAGGRRGTETPAEGGPARPMKPSGGK